MLRIVVRTNTDWANMTMSKFVNQQEPQSPREFVRIGKELLPQWEQATGQNYFHYRERVRRLCFSKLRTLELPITVGADNVNWNSEDEFLIPIDDDDILLPSVKTIAEHINESVNLVIWQRITNYLGNERLENPSFGGQLDTCNWAIRKSFLAQWGYSDRLQVLSRHWYAAGIMSPKLGGKVAPTDLLGRAKKALTFRTAGIYLRHPSIIVLNEKHSVYYLHSASISFLANKFKDEGCDFAKVVKTLPLHPLVKHV